MKMTTFQLVFTGIFIFFILIGVGVFALYNSNANRTVGSVVVWGTFPQDSINQVLQTLRATDKSFTNVLYVQKSPVTYEGDLINAMAGGSPPDLFLVSQQQMGTFTDKVITIPYNLYPQGQFVSSFIDEGQIFLTPQGSLGLPFIIDPLVMYWNRDLFASAGISTPPQYWNQLLTMAPKLSVTGAGGSVSRSAVPLGEWTNVPNAKATLSALFMQAGDKIVVRDAQGALRVVFGSTPQNAAENPASSALNFYTEFANPSKTTYSWNHSLPMAHDAFTGGTLAMYFGFASEYASIAARNPNLHFGVSLLPQIQGNPTKLTYGRLYALAIPRNATNPQGALAIATRLTGVPAIQGLIQQTGLPPVRRDVSVDTSGSAAAMVFAQSALISSGWLDPNSRATDGIFQSMVQSVLTGQSLPDQAVNEAAQTMQTLVR